MTMTMTEMRARVIAVSELFAGWRDDDAHWLGALAEDYGLDADADALDLVESAFLRAHGADLLLAWRTTHGAAPYNSTDWSFARAATLIRDDADFITSARRASGGCSGGP